MNFKGRITMVLALFCTVGLMAQRAESAEDIIRIMDEQQTFKTTKIVGVMINEDRFGEKRSEYIAWSRGGSDFLIEFTNIEERGQKVLRVGDEIFLFYPDAEDIIPIHGSALKQSLFGDISYEDITEGRNTLDKYDVKITGEEQVKGDACWVIEMVAKSRDVPYPKQIIKVGKDDYVLREGEYFSRSNRLLKTISVLGTREFERGKVMITEMLLEDEIRRNSRTIMRVKEAEINERLDEGLFSLRSLY